MDEKGDIICVRPDGFEWSNSELPRVIKVPGMKYEDAVQYEQSLSIVDDVTHASTLIKKRKYKIPNLFEGSKLDAASISLFQITDIVDKVK